MEVFIIVGLGNPGPDYAHTRHNAGFEVMTLLEKHYGVEIRRKMLQGLLAEITDGSRKIVLCEPQTFMNASGECVSKILRWYHVSPDHLMVIYDDIDLPPGKVRVRRSGGPGTHNGMRSILAQGIGESFPRIRVGTGDRPAGWDLADWVLARPAGEDQAKLEKAYALAAEAAVNWVERGIDDAMKICHDAQREPKLESAHRTENEQV